MLVQGWFIIKIHVKTTFMTLVKIIILAPLSKKRKNSWKLIFFTIFVMLIVFVWHVLVHFFCQARKLKLLLKARGGIPAWNWWKCYSQEIEKLARKKRMNLVKRFTDGAEISKLRTLTCKAVIAIGSPQYSRQLWQGCLWWWKNHCASNGELHKVML